jgi:hypothetical protein
VQTGTGEENSLSSGIERKNPLRDLHRVTEHPEDSARSFLSRRIARRASIFLHLREKGRKTKSLRGLSVKKLRRDSTCVCVKTLQRSAEVKESFEDSRSKSSGGTTLLRMHEENSSHGARREKRSKGRGLWKLEILPRLGRKCQELRREHNSRQIG